MACYRDSLALAIRARLAYKHQNNDDININPKHALYPGRAMSCKLTFLKFEVELGIQQ
jgi:hypothetical protein